MVLVHDVEAFLPYNKSNKSTTKFRHQYKSKSSTTHISPHSFHTFNTDSSKRYGYTNNVDLPHFQRGGGSDDDGLVLVGKIKRLNASYMHLLDNHPCQTKSISAGFVTAIGDVLAQCIERWVEGTSFVLNFHRMWAFTIAATVFVGPFVHYIYELLWLIGRRLEDVGVPKTWRTMIQVIFDQTVGVWTFYPTYFYVHALVEALVMNKFPDFSQIQGKIKNELFGVIVSNYKLWPIANYVNFTYVPENLRVLFSNFVSILWNAYLCTRMAS